MVRASWVALLACAAACQSSGGGGRACVTSAECAGRACVNGACVTLGDAGMPRDGGTGGDGGGIADGGGVPADGGLADGGAAFDGGSFTDGGAAPDGGEGADGGASANRLLGADCDSDGDCQSGVCLRGSVLDTPFAVCARLCCSEGACPTSDGTQRFGCIEFYGANFCLTDRVFANAGVTTVRFERSAGQSCGADDEMLCRSGICRANQQGQRLCRATCCSNADCGALGCALRPAYAAGEISHHVCELPLLGTQNGDACSSELECDSYMCIPMVGPQPFCSNTCCTAADCPQGWSCVQIESGPSGASNLGMGCLPAGAGNDPVGAACSTFDFPNECATDICVDGACRLPCCRDDHCPEGQVCRAVDNGQMLAGLNRTGKIRICVVP